MFSPKFTITSTILQSIGQIEASKAIIDASPIIPAYEKKFQQDAIVRAVHYGTKLEGNELSFTEAAQVIEGKKVFAAKRDIQEVINYRQVMDYLEQLLEKTKRKEDCYNKEVLLTIHRLTVDKIVPPEQAGCFRKVQVSIRNTATDELFYRPPPPMEVPYLIDDFFAWLNSAAADKIHPVLKSGIVHYVLAAIHPFTEGNGRTARAMATLVLMREGYNIKRLFALEEYFDRHAEEYYNSLQAVSFQPGELSDKDATVWLEFFTTALRDELKRVEEKVRQLSSDIHLKNQLGGKQIPLTERQIKLVEYMRQYGGLRIIEAKELFPTISDDTIWRDLRKLIEAGIVEKRGSTKGAYYCLKN